MKKKRSIAGCIKEFWPATILTPVFVIGEVVFDVLIPTMTGKLLDEGVEAGSMHHIALYGLTVVAMALVALLLGALSGRFTAKASTGLSRNLRREMYANVQKFSFSNIDKYSTGGIITRLTTDVTNVQMAFMMIIRIAVRCPIMLICAWVMTFTINPQLALVFLVVIPVLALGLLFIMTRAHPIFERVFKKYDWMNNVVQENLLGIRVVKSFVREEHEKEKFGKVSKEIYLDFSKAEKILAFNSPLMQLCVAACILTVSWLGAHLIVDGSMTTGQLTSMFSYIMMILMNLMMLSMVVVMIVIARASAERITELLNEESDLQNGPNPIEEVKDGSVVFENVSFSYAKDPSKECLKDVNLTIKSGETVGILGGTGTSKTTLVQLIPRLYDATEGRVLGRRGRAGLRHGGPAGAGCHGAPEERALLRHHQGQPALGQQGGHRRGDGSGVQAGPGRPLHPGVPRQVRHLHRAGRLQRVRRPEAAPVHCPRPAEKAQDPDPGRLHLRRGHQDRRADPQGVPGGDPRDHQVHHRPAHLLH